MNEPFDEAGLKGLLLPVPKQPFLPDERFRIRRVGRPYHTGIGVYVFSDVAEEILYTSRYRAAQTTAAVLTGGYYRGAAGRFVEIRGFQMSTVVSSALDFAQQLKGNYQAIHADPALIEAGQRPVGWFLSRPGSMGRPGPFELIVHLSFFNLPYHLCLMLDPQQQLAGLFAHAGDTHLTNVGFNLIEPVQPADG